MNTLSLELGPPAGAPPSTLSTDGSASAHSQPSAPSPLSAINLAGRKIMVVDDDRLNLRILGGILRGENYVLSEVNSGEAALAHYAEFQPDLVLLDVMMPGIDGFETCRQLKRTHGENCAPIVFITAKTESDDVVQGLAAGGTDYLPKPFRPKEVTARIRAHLHGAVLAEQQKQLVDQLSKANAAKNRFLGMAAHDLRNPLASIRGLSEFLIDGTVGALTADQLELVTTIQGASQAMLELVNDLLDVATIEAGELKLRVERQNLIPLIAKSVSLSNNEAVKKRTHVVLQGAEVPLVAEIDPAKMRQVIDNLISNAVKYSPPGATITVELHGNAKEIGFSVKDQGPGIPDNERDKLFKDFSQLSTKPTAGEKSTGLGLAICQKIVAAHRGSIVVQNLPIQGCEFRVTVPISQ